MTAHGSDGDDLNKLIGMLETIEIDRLKHITYKRYISQLLEISKQSLSIDGTRLNLIIQHVKTYDRPCFQRDVILDLVAKLVSDNLSTILKEPFAKSSSGQWNDLACSIATLPDLVANCKAIEKYPHLKKEPFYNRLIEQVYESLEYRSNTVSSTDTEYKCFTLKLLGRITLAGHSSLVWHRFTRRAIYEAKSHVRQLGSDIIRLAINPPPELTTFDLFIDHLCLPVFLNLTPRRGTGQLIKSFLGSDLADSEHLRYLICDKSIFRTNYHLSKENQAIVLFNIAAYLSSLVTPHSDNVTKLNQPEQGMSLLFETLLEIVKSWTNPTKIIVRTYQHSKYISCALLIFFRFASQHDNKQLADHVNKIQSMIVNSIPIYLNRANHEQRNLACCLCGLILPKLRDIMLNKQTNGEEIRELQLDFKVDLDDDLLYLQRVFNLDVDILFQANPDVSIEATTNKIISSNVRSEVIASAGASAHVVEDDHLNTRRLNDKQPQAKPSDLNDDDDNTTTRHPTLKEGVLVDLINRRCASGAARVQMRDRDEDDLLPYDISEDDDNDPDDDELEIGDEATCVPIYLRDCINGLIENNNHRYVRLCLIKANSLIDEMIKQQDDADAQRRGSVCLAARPGNSSSSDRSAVTGEPMVSRRDDVNDTIKDVGVELARTLLFMENQFNMEKFDDYRMTGLVSLCFAAPGLVGKYLVDELNGTSRSMRQQLDILNVLVAASHKLAFGTSSTIEPNSSKQLVVSSPLRKTKKGVVNRFAPYASLFFYGISHRLKADFLDARSLIISQPQSIMSAFREHQGTNNGDSKTTIGEPDIILKAIDHANNHVSLQKASNLLKSSLLNVDEQRSSGKTNGSLERDSLSDDSYLLSRILLSISNILRCSAQQPVTCKLSSDLLGILAAYRCHPDSGVQRAIVSCLKMIRDCTPNTYYSDYIEGQMLRSFGPWLARNESNIQR